jgi:hypothetical protein
MRGMGWENLVVSVAPGDFRGDAKLAVKTTCETG